MPSYSYSRDRKLFHGEFDTAHEAARAFFDSCPDLTACWVGEIVPAAHSGSFVSPQSIVEDAQCQAVDLFGEAAEGWLDEVLCDQARMDQLQKLVGDWLHQQEPPTFHGVSNIESVTRALREGEG